MEREDEERFAHPVERELARVFEQHGIAWEYEPRTFVLEREPESGQVVQACTPDFYLPELDVYLECTVMRQRHVNRKNQKVRKVRERYDVLVQVLYRRDILRLARRHRLPELERAARS
jgi:hypoxanthine phosphoribosyltransferase